MRTTLAMIGLAVLLAGPVSSARAQEAPGDAAATSARVDRAVFDEAVDAYVRQRRNMAWAIGSWAGANIVAGSIGWGLADDPAIRAFHQTNILWNAINLPFAFSTRPPSELPSDTVALLRARESQRLILWINAGLDVGYIATGLWVRELGYRQDERLLGVGASFVAQGAWLLVYDIVGAIRAGGAANRLWDDLRVAITPSGATATLTW